jgi:hypothetical protein
MQEPGTSAGQYGDDAADMGEGAAGFSGRDEYLDIEVDGDDGRYAGQNGAAEAGRGWQQPDQERRPVGRERARPSPVSSPDRWSPVADIGSQDDDWD